MNHSGRRDALLVLNKFLNLFVKGVLLPLLILSHLLRAKGVLLLSVVVTLSLFGVEEWIEEFLLSVNS
jgi:hypothetical protein